MCEGKKANIESCLWWKDCINDIKMLIFQDKTTTRDNLREKAINYALNYLSGKTEVSYLDKNAFARHIADEIESTLKDVVFDQRPLASVVAKQARDTIAREPENKYIKLR